MTSSAQPSGDAGEAGLDAPAVDLDAVYGGRFSDAEADKKDRVWKEITRYLQRYISPGAAVLDIACDRGDFIRNIHAGEKWATDLRDVRTYLDEEIRFVRANGLELAEALPNSHFDVVFMSNYLEHLPTNNDVVEQLRVAHRLLKDGGRLIVLQLNIRFVGGRYWDFIDHSVALTERSLVEAGALASFSPLKVIPRFLPYTTKSRLPSAQWLVRAYLSMPVAWRLFGEQTLYVGIAVPVASGA